MRQMTMREANQQFSKLAREIEETGETIIVLRNGKPALKLSPAQEVVRKPTQAQREALAFLKDPKNHFKSPPGWRFNKEELYDEAVSRHSATRKLWGVTEKKVRKSG